MAHEMGHYVLCRYYGVRATLPFFIPAPTLIGTLGAVIRIKAPIRSRAALFDIGVAGPIAGFVVAVVTLAMAMTISKPLVPGAALSDVRLGYPGIFYLVQHALRSLSRGNEIASLPLSRVYLHPTAIAAWVGMFATALNLLPERAIGWRSHRVRAGAACTQNGFLAHSTGAGPARADVSELVGVGWTFVRNERADAPPETGSQLS